jgi:hypothetical protein
VDGSKLMIDSVYSEHLVYGSVTGSKLAEGSIEGSKLANGIIGSKHLADGAVTGAKLGDRAITGAKLADASVDGTKLVKGSVRREHLSDDLIQETTIQQFGLLPFELKVQGEIIDVLLNFNESFADQEYVITAMTNHPACYAIVKQKHVESAVLSVVRSRFSPEQHGVINWIAIGNKA